MPSQNGWSVDHTGTLQDRRPLYGQVSVPNGVRAGDVATIFRYVARRYNDTVQPLKVGQCWGWHVKTIEGSESVSNHASGTAVDFNAPDLPMGVKTTALLTARQIKAARAIVAYCDGVIRWGGDYTGRADAMHWEIIGTPAQAAALARKITKEQNVTAPTADQNAQAVVGRDIDPGPGTYSLAGAVWVTLGRTATLNSLPGQIGALHTDLNARVQDVDDELDGMGASIVLLVALVSSMLADPVMESNPLYDLMRQAVRAELDVQPPAPPAG